MRTIAHFSCYNGIMQNMESELTGGKVNPLFSLLFYENPKMHALPAERRNRRWRNKRKEGEGMAGGPRNPARDKGLEIFLEMGGEIKNAEIAKMVGATADRSGNGSALTSGKKNLLKKTSPNGADSRETRTQRGMVRKREMKTP